MNLTEKLKQTDKAILCKVVNGIDGHSIYDPKKFLNMGLDQDIVKKYTRIHSSGLEPKSQIFVDNQQVEELPGVYGLQLLEFIATCYNVSSWKMGRGSRANHLAEQLLEIFNAK